MAKDKGDDKDDDSSDMKEAMFQVSDGVIGAGVLIMVGVFGGNWLDAKLNTAPWLTVILSMLGGGLGLVRLVKKAMQIGQKSGPSKATASTYIEDSENKSEESKPAQEGKMRMRKPLEEYKDD